MGLIRAERNEDKASIHAIVRAAFGRADEADLVDALRNDLSFVPELSLVFEDGGHLVGHILFTIAPIVGTSGHWPALALAPVAVLPERQNLGVGSALVRHGLAEARRLGHRLVVVLGHATYYPRFGFSSASQAGITAPFPVNDESFMAIELVAGAFGGMEGTIQYAPPFAKL